MSYVDQKSGPSPAGMASAVIVQSGIAALVVMGLSVAGGVVETRDVIDTWDIRDTPPEPEPEPMPEPEPQAQPEVTSQPPISVPEPKFDFDAPVSASKTTIDTPERPIIITPRPPVAKPPAPPAPTPTFDAVSAKPRNDPGAWLTNSDYRSSWVRREYTGVAGFRLDIAASGKVTGCRITSSTGHSELDEATCKLIQRRARFEPARGPNGEPVAGSFSSSVRWQLPE